MSPENLNQKPYLRPFIQPAKQYKMQKHKVETFSHPGAPSLGGLCVPGPHKFFGALRNCQAASQPAFASFCCNFRYTSLLCHKIYVPHIYNIKLTRLRQRHCAPFMIAIMFRVGEYGADLHDPLAWLSLSVENVELSPEICCSA